MNYRTLKLYQNYFEENSGKGSFIIGQDGMMFPKTRNSTLWGLASSSYIPQEFKENPRIVTTLKDKLSLDISAQMSAFYKFQKSNLNVAIEAISMEFASHFDIPTSFNCPVYLDNSPNSLAYKNGFDNFNQMGSLVFSFLGKNEYLYTFSKINNDDSSNINFTTTCSTIKNFVKEKTNLPYKDTYQTYTELQNHFAYQYLFRDCFGDIDFTSKNSGLVFNEDTEKISIAPHFDFGEMMNVLCNAKFCEPKLIDINSFSEQAKQLINIKEIEQINQNKLAFSAKTPEELGKISTFAEDSTENITTICSKFPKTALKFTEDLQKFKESNLVEDIVAKYAGEDNLLTEEQGEMIVEFANSRMDNFSNTLIDTLKNTLQLDNLQNATEVTQ